jgi:hypothetical protein
MYTECDYKFICFVQDLPSASSSERTHAAIFFNNFFSLQRGTSKPCQAACAGSAGVRASSGQGGLNTSLWGHHCSTLPALPKVPALSKQLKRGASSTRSRDARSPRPPRPLAARAALDLPRLRHATHKGKAPPLAWHGLIASHVITPPLVQLVAAVTSKHSGELYAAQRWGGAK